MSVAVSIPTILRSYTNNEKSVTAQGTNLQEVIADLETQFPGISERLIEDGNLRRFVNIYINDEDVRFTGSLAAAGLRSWGNRRLDLRGLEWGGQKSENHPARR
jgi:molybdopterin converting factor small subunit